MIFINKSSSKKKKLKIVVYEWKYFIDIRKNSGIL